MSLFIRAKQVLNQEGLFVFLRKGIGFVYEKSFRKYLPIIGYYTMNGVKVEKKYLLDEILLKYKSDSPKNEDGIVSSHREITEQSDVVVAVGGGNGVSAVRAADIVGESGNVTVYEGGKESVEKVRHVININNVENVCGVRHAVVGKERNVYGGESTTADIIQPDSIPDCDILELDCEGAEIDILRELPIQPRGIVAELHPWNFQEDPGTILDILSELGYEITHQFGHDGTHLSEEEFETLLLNSNVQGEQYLKSGGRWPVVVVAVLSDT